jgi:hypothetical protein
MAARWGRAAATALALAAIASAGVVLASESDRDLSRDAAMADWRRAVAPAARGVAASADPRLQLVAADMLLFQALPATGPREKVMLEAVRPEAEAVYARLRAGSSDFLVLWLAATDCPFGEALCDRDGAIDTLLRLEPDNAAPWFLALDRAVQRKDATAIDAALEGIAASRHYRQGLADQVRTWIDGYIAIGAQPEAPPGLFAAMSPQLLQAPVAPRHRRALVGMTGHSIGLFRGHPRFLAFSEVCGREVAVEAARRERCRAAARVLRDADIVVVTSMAIRALYRLADEDATRAEAEREFAVFQWMMEHHGQVAPEVIDAAGVFHADEALALLAAWRAHDSEREVFAAFARAAGVPLEPPADWRPRYTLAEREAMK